MSASKGVALTELMTVIAVIGIIGAIAMLSVLNEQIQKPRSEIKWVEEGRK